MMKATTWFCPLLLTLLCAARLVCTAQRGGGGGYPLDYLDAQALQDNYILAKRNKPSLSIVNPLDVLRQRLLLEIARRQMKENTRQVELNRAILKNVGKRVVLGSVPATRRFQQQQLEQQRQQELQQQHFPSQLWSYAVPSASSRFFDFLQEQRPQTQQRHELASQQVDGRLDDAKKSLNAVGLSMSMTKHQPNGNEIANETNHENGSRKELTAGKSATGTVDIMDDPEDELADDDDGQDSLNWAAEEQNGMTELYDAEDANRHLPWRFLYRLHQNKHYAN